MSKKEKYNRSDVIQIKLTHLTRVKDMYAKPTKQLQTDETAAQLPLNAPRVP